MSIQGSTHVKRVDDSTQFNIFWGLAFVHIAHVPLIVNGYYTCLPLGML